MAGFGTLTRTRSALVAMVLALGAVVAVPTSANATTISGVATEVDFRAALTALSADATAGPHVIEITASFSISDTGSGDPTYSGTEDLTIDGGGFTISSGADDLRFLDATCSCVVRIEDLTVDGFTMTAASAFTFGAAVISDDADVFVDGSTFSHNTIAVTDTSSDPDVFMGGAAIALGAGDLNITDSTFTNNTVTATAKGSKTTGTATLQAYGGAVFTDSGDIAIGDDSVFKANSATGVADAWFVETMIVAGGAAFSGGGAIDASTGSSFVNNKAKADLTYYSTGVEDSDGWVIGGAIATATEAVYVDEAAFTGNSAIGVGAGPIDWLEFWGEGGAIYGEDDVFVSASTFTNNKVNVDGPDAAASGGAITAYGSSPGAVVSDSDFTGNSAYANVQTTEDSSEAYGGAIAAFEVGALVTDSTFTSNTVTSNGKHDIESYGGALFTYDYAVIERVSFVNNKVKGKARDDAEGGGGAIYFEGGAGTFEFTDSEFISNSVVLTSTHEDSEVYGGAITEWGDGGGTTVEFARTTFASNVAKAVARRGTAEAYGGAIELWELDGVFENSTFTGNSALADGDAEEAYGGAIYSEDEPVDVTNATFTKNKAADGAHVYTLNEEFSATSSVFADALGSDGCAVSALSTGEYNFDDDGSCSHSGVPADNDFGLGDDPEFEALGYNGGLTQTLMPKSTSPLVDADLDCPLSGGGDQNGISRPNGAECEPGASEYVGPEAFTVSTVAGDIDVSVFGSCGIVSSDPTATVVDGAYTPTAPADVIIPFGAFNFVTCVPVTGGSVTVVLDLPSKVNSLWKIDADWSKITGATFSGTTASYTLTDGGGLDTDGSADGEAADPVAPGIVLSLTG